MLGRRYDCNFTERRAEDGIKAMGEYRSGVLREGERVGTHSSSRCWASREGSKGRDRHSQLGYDTHDVFKKPKSHKPFFKLQHPAPHLQRGRPASCHRLSGLWA